MALGHSDPRLIWLRPHKMMGLELVIPTHWICPYIPPLFACPELARVALFDIAIVCCNTILCPTPITPHLRYLYYLYLLPVTVDHFATRASFHPLWCLHVGGTRGHALGSGPGSWVRLRADSGPRRTLRHGGCLFASPVLSTPTMRPWAAVR